MERKRSYLRNERWCCAMMRKIDVFGEPVQWYIENDTHFGTVIGGCRSFMVIFISAIFLLYCFINLFYNRVGSFLYYDATLPHMVDNNITYFDLFELFFFVKDAKNNVVNLNQTIAKAYLHQTFNYTSKCSKESESEDNENITSTTVSYPFDICNDTYSREVLQFSPEIHDKLTNQIYCIDRNKYKDKNLTFVLSSSLLLGTRGHALVLQIKQICQIPNACTSAENLTYTLLLAKMKEMQVFIKGIIPNPSNVTHPYMDSMNSIEISKPTSVYFKNYEIATDSHLFPNLAMEYDYFHSFEKSEINQEELSSSELKLTFLLSNNYSYIHRNYQKIDSLLGSFIGVINVLLALGRFITLLFCNFDNEFFLYNHTLSKRIKFPEINKTNKGGGNDMKNAPAFHPKPAINNSTQVIMPNQLNFQLNQDINNINNPIQRHYNEKPSELFLYLDPLKNDNIEQLSKDKKLNHKPQQCTQTPPKSSFNKTIYYNSNIPSNDIKTIQLGRWRHFWSMIIYYIPSCDWKQTRKTGKTMKILSIINLMHNLFDTSVYITNVLDVMKLKQLLMANTQLKLFENVSLSFNQLQKELSDIASNIKTNLSMGIVNKLKRELEDTNDPISDWLCNQS